MLTICDKGALLFADRYLLKTLERELYATETTESERPSESTNVQKEDQEWKVMNKPRTAITVDDEAYLQMGFFMKEIIIEEVIAKEPTIIRKAIYPTK